MLCVSTITLYLLLARGLKRMVGGRFNGGNKNIQVNAAVAAERDALRVERDAEAAARAAAEAARIAAETAKTAAEAEAATTTATLVTRTTERDAKIAEVATLNQTLTTTNATLEARTAERNAALTNALRIPTSIVTTTWTWAGTLTTGSDWQNGKFTSLQHDTGAAGPGLTVTTESGEPVLNCRVSSAMQPVSSATHKRSEGVLSAIGSPGDILEGDISTQECEAWFPTNFFATNSDSLWAVGPFQVHQDLSLGNGGPTLAWEIHQDRLRQRTMNGVFDKPVNSGVWSTLGGTGTGGVLHTTSVTSVGRGAWVPFKVKWRNALSWNAGWVEVYINNILVRPRFYMATMDFDAASTFRPSRNYLKFGFYQEGSIGERILKLRRIKATKDRPMY